MKNKEPKIACVIVNWKSPYETADCVKSVLSGYKVPDLIYIVDNNSEDNSLSYIKKSIETTHQKKIQKKYLSENIIYFQSKKNLGYAGGNNIAIREILKIDGIDLIWILNNDAIVSLNTLQEMTKMTFKKPNSGFFGSPILYQGTDLLQCYGGGIYYSRLGISRLLYNKKRLYTTKTSRRQPDYIMGCNLLVRRTVIEQCGMLSEKFFMYSEDVEWQLRSKDRWSVSVADNTHIFHGTLESRSKRDRTYYYYKNRSSISAVKMLYGIHWASLSFLAHIIIIFLDKPQKKTIPSALNGLIHGLLK